MANHELPFGVSFPGVEMVEDASYVDTQGVTPSVALLKIVPQNAPISMVGTIRFWQGTEERVLEDCKIMKTQVDKSGQGFITQLSILDRRWKWAFGEISGHYNLRDDKTGDQQQIIPETEKTPQELAILLLEAQGESGYNVSALPNSTRPMVQWEAALPMTELAGLCESLGCRVVRDLRDKVVIVQVGEGGELPNLPDIEETKQAGYDPPEAPDFVLVVASKTRFQMDFRLEPWGQDVDGEFKHIDDLSYAPDDGWGVSIGPPFFTGTNIAGLRSEYLEDLAAKWIFRRYRITLARWDGAGSTDEPALLIPGYLEYGLVTDLSLVEIEPVQVETYTDALLHTDTPLPATIRGQWWNGGLDWANNTFPAYYQGAFTVADTVKGFVDFTDYVYKIDTDGSKVGADLILRCAASFRNKQTRAWVRHSVRGKVNNSPLGTKDKILAHGEIVRNVYPEYDANTYPTQKVTTNDNQIEVEMSYYVDAARRDFAASATETKDYGALVPIQLSGTIQQVSYQLSQKGITTSAGWNTEHLPYVPSWAERRQAERLRNQSRELDT